MAARKDCTLHGSGMLLLCKNYLLADVTDCPDCYVAGSCELITMCFKSIVLLCIYCQPSDTDVTIIDSLTRFRAAYPQPMIIMGILMFTIKIGFVVLKLQW